jgi:hypothetical protein
MVHQLGVHLGTQHLFHEHMFLAAICHTHKEHWLFELFSCIDGAVPFTNRVFGVDLINGVISDFLALDERATENVVPNTIRRMYRSMHVENGGDDYRAARQVCPSLDGHYRAYLQFAGQVVSACRTDHYTTAWQRYALGTDKCDIVRVLANILFTSTVLHDHAHADELESLVGVAGAKHETSGNSRSATIGDLLFSRRFYSVLSGSSVGSPVVQMHTFCKKYGLVKSLERLDSELREIQRRNYPLYIRFGTMMH